MSAREHVFTLGIEEEFQIIDPQTRELRSHIQQILEGGRMTLKERIKPEMHQSVVELGTEVCQDATAARQQVIALRRHLAMVAAGRGPNDRVGRDAPFLSLARPADYHR
jgi:glutamate---cysteine ligase / carboxylate-amine ligase